jgi:outer membrane protein TolC
LAALHQERADRSAIKANDADLLPKVDLQGQVMRRGRSTKWAFEQVGGARKTNDFTTAQSVGVNLSMPLYEGGAIRGKTRELREVAEQRRIAIETARRKVTQQLIEAWEAYSSAKANIQQYRTQVEANKVSLEGTRQEMLVGSKILLDVLNAQRELVSSQLNLVRAEQEYYQSAYNILALMGRLTVLNLKLKVKQYDPRVHYRDVRNSW